MQINVSYDSSVSGAPSGFTANVDAAVQYLENEFSTPVTINIDVGYGEVDGNPVASGYGRSYFPYSVPVSYSALKSVLIAESAPGAGALPDTSPLGGTLYLSPAQATALGFRTNDGSTDGYVGFGSLPSVGLVLHEITETMGRVSFLDDQPYDYSAIDLFRFSAPGVPDTSTGGAGSTAYFSIDNGATNLGSWNNDPTNGLDLADWWGSNIPNGADPFEARGGANASISQSDITLVEAIGWDTLPTGPWSRIDGRTPIATIGGDFSGSGTAQLVASYSGFGTYAYANGAWAKIDGGTPYLMSSGDFTTAGHLQLAGVFAGSGTYTWTRSAGWQKIDNGTPNVMTSGDFSGSGHDQLGGVFAGYGTYTWSAGNGWQKIDNGTPASLTSGDFTNIGHSELAGVFAGFGSYLWDARNGWQKIDNGTPTQIVAGDFYGNGTSDLAGYFAGYGTYIWSTGSGWTKIDAGKTAGLASVDLNGDGKNELLAYFPGSGVYEWQQGVGWSKYDDAPGLPSSAQQALFATGNFQGGSPIDAAISFPGQGGVWLDPPSNAAITPIPDAPVTIAEEATVEITDASAAPVTFSSATGYLQLDQSLSFFGTVAGLGARNEIDLRDIGASGAAATFIANEANTGGTLTVSDGIYGASIALLGNYMASTFVTSSDGHGGTLVNVAQDFSQSTTLAHPA